MKGLVSFFVVALLLAAAITTYGDIARPQPSPKEPKVVLYTNLDVLPDSVGHRAKLQISQQTLNDLREAMNASAGSSQSLTGSISRNPTSTIIAGLFLFMSISFAGVWLMRSSRLPNSRGTKAAAAALVSVAMLGAAVVITRGNAGPPPSYYWRNLTKNLNAGKPTNGGIEVEIVPDGTGMKLIVPLKRDKSD